MFPTGNIRLSVSPKIIEFHYFRIGERDLDSHLFQIHFIDKKTKF